MTRKALGRGLNALLGDVVQAAAPEVSISALAQIPVGLIDPNPFQPRRVISKQQLDELAQSIQATGVVQPVLVRKMGERYQLVAGERRWRAAAQAKLDAVPAIVREISDLEAVELALTENILREDLSPIEVARAFHSLHEKFRYNHEEIATRMGLDRSTVTNALRLLRLPESIQQLIEDKRLTSGHARALLSCETSEQQLLLAERIVKDGLSVRQTESLATASPVEHKAAGSEEATVPKQDPNLRAAALELERTLGTRVKIAGDEQRGRIEISYYSAQDLNRLYDWIVRK